jgi:hypothetical protein
LKRVSFALFFLLSGCATIAPPPPSQVPKYQLTLTGTIDQAPFQGTGVGSAASHHDITISSSVTVNYFTVQSCHRSLQFKDVIDVGWFNNNKSYAWSYDEAPTIEDTGDCILRFCAFSATVGSPPVACAVVDFNSSRYTLPLENICNGADVQASGTAICHTQVGLLERVRFKSPVVVAPDVQDPTGKTPPYWISGQCAGTFIDAAQTLWEYQIPNQECVVIFMEQAKPHRRAKLTVVPYTDTQYQ